MSANYSMIATAKSVKYVMTSLDHIDSNLWVDQTFPKTTTVKPSTSLHNVMHEPKS